MNNYKFKFKYNSAGLKASGDGTCKAESMDEAIEAAAQGVAKDFGGSGVVAITSISKYTPRKKKPK